MVIYESKCRGASNLVKVVPAAAVKQLGVFDAFIVGV